MPLVVGDPVDNQFQNTFTCVIHTHWNDFAYGERVEIPVKANEAKKLDTVLAAISRTEYEAEKIFAIRNAKHFFGEVDGERIDWPYNHEFGRHHSYFSHEYFWYDASGRKYHANLKGKS